MPLLIDTYNVLHTVGVLPPELAGVDLQGLIRLLAATRYGQERITLVCDGTPKTADERKPESLGLTLAIRYSGAGKTADDLIKQIILASTAPRRLIVVSSDHEVLRSARKRRCVTLTSEELLQHCVEDANMPRTGTASTQPAKPPPSAMTEAQIDRWINVFQLDADTVAIPANESEHIASVSPHASAASNEPNPQQGDAPQPVVPEHEIVQLPPGVVVPLELIRQAEQLWAQQHRKSDQP